MAKKRVFEVAREFNISSEALLGILRRMDYDVKSHMSVVNERMSADIRRRFEEEKEAVKKEIAKKKRKQEERERLKQKGVKGKAKKTGKREEVVLEEKRRPRKKRARKEPKVDQKAVELSVKKTLAQMKSKGRPKRRRKVKGTGGTIEEEANVIRVSEFVSVAELADQMEIKPTEVIGKCLEMGLLVTINQRLDMDTIVMVADEFGYEVEPLPEYGVDILEEEEKVEESELVSKAPVVTIMGHVDHGKTSLLDYIRESNVIAGEAGSITQHIGAYGVELPKGKITFLDTPGHEAFTAIRARGAQATDVVVLVVAANDGVMPQTVEAIDHAKAAGVPIVVAINKIDLPSADPEKVKRQLAGCGLLVEEWGGKTIAVEVSAKTGQGIDRLLDMLLLEAEVLELKANSNRKAKGVIIDSGLDKGRGPVATVLVQEGTLRAGSSFVTGLHSGKARALMNERGHAVSEAGPSTPVQVLGISGVPQAGDSFFVVDDEKKAKEISLKRQQLKREQEYRPVKRITLDEIYQQIQSGEIKELSLIIKGDVGGSVEALSDSLMKLHTDEVRVKVIHQGVGAISESDVLLAGASNAIIIGFHVRPDARAKELAEREMVDIRFYDVIYEAISEVEAALEGLLEPETRENTIGMAEIRQVFRIPKVGNVAGCYVQSGYVRRDANARLLRDNVVIYEGTISSLRRFKDDIKQIQSGFECGIRLKNFEDLKENDVLEVYEVVETAKELKV